MKNITLVFFFFFSLGLFSQCIIKNSDGQVASTKNDALFNLLTKDNNCINNGRSLREKLLKKGYEVKASMVANRGFNNPHDGSFSFFESVSGNDVGAGDFFFGHFASGQNGRIDLVEGLGNGLLIEAIVWDTKKELFNFYELIASRKAIQWFYRGDSHDALLDNIYLYRKPPRGEIKFGDRMRCSACHNSGGPIMKELSSPHNDWWLEKRPLILNPNRPSPQVSNYLEQVIDANIFSEHVKLGINKLEKSRTYSDLKAQRTLEEQLRPLFCETEINIESDLEARSISLEKIQIPSAFFINPFLAQTQIEVERELYDNMLKKFRLSFPETELLDADHAWLTPVKAYADHLAVSALIENKIVDENFVTEVYSIDLATPMFSFKRCNLLELLPENYSTNWQQIFIKNLRASSMPDAQKLADLLENSSLRREHVTLEAKAYLEKVREALKGQDGVEIYFNKLLKVRQEVFKSEISQNPRGQILEPGFRVIFPEPVSEL